MNFCPVCHILVAPADPRRVVKDGETYHASCLKKPKPQPVQLDLDLGLPIQ